MDDTGLILALQAHRPEGMECLQRRFTPLLRYIIAAILPDERDREECLSDVFLQVWDAAGGYDSGRAALSTWLARLARNAALNRRRANERRREDGAPDEFLPDAADTPEQSAIRAETARLVWEAVGRLDERDRALLLRGLWKLSKNLDEAGYALTPAPVKYPAGASMALWLGPALLAVAALTLVFSRFPVESRPAEYDNGGEQVLRGELVELGFPEELLSHLSDGQAAKFWGAYGVSVQDDSAVPDDMPGHFTLVEVPVRDEHYGFRTVYLCRIHWDEEDAARCRYMEGVKLNMRLDRILRVSCPEGVLEWTDGGGVRRTASLTFRPNGATYAADFSLPKGLDGPVDGYLFWDVVSSSPETYEIYNSQLALAHRTSLWTYPYTQPSGLFGEESLFPTYPPGWKVAWQRPFLNTLAPEGQYEPYKY